MAYECRQCGDKAKIVAEKCPSCGYRGEDDRTDARQTGRGFLALSLLVIPAPITLPLGIAFYLGSFLKPKEGEAPFEGMTREEWRSQKD